MSRPVVYSLLLVLALSGSVRVDERMTFGWQVEKTGVAFTLRLDNVQDLQADWWSVSITRELDKSTDVFLVNSTGLDTRFSLSDCCPAAKRQSHDAGEGYFTASFFRSFLSENCCAPLVRGDVYIATSRYGDYLGEGTVEKSVSPEGVPFALTNHFTGSEVMQPTLSYVLGIAAFLGLLYFAA